MAPERYSSSATGPASSLGGSSGTVKTTLELIDAAAVDRVLLFGSLPPAGRDLDLLARAREVVTIRTRLAGCGFVNHGARWAAFHNRSAESVELVPAEDWRLPPEEIEALFSEAVPLPGSTHVVRPAPHHLLLIAARKFVRHCSALGEKERGRIDRALAEDPRAWERAAERARLWGAEEALTLLHRAYTRGCSAKIRERARSLAQELEAGGDGVVAAWAGALRALAPTFGRGTAVALSGVDGAGKSLQADSLRATLELLGHDVTVLWVPLGRNAALDLVGVPIKRLISLLRFGPLAQLAEAAASGSVMSSGAPSTSHADAVARHLWATFVVLLNALSQRRAAIGPLLRGRVVIFDRHVLDSVVVLRFLYGEKNSFALEKWLLRVVAPAVRAAYFLDIEPETSLARKADWCGLDDLRRMSALYRAEAQALEVRRLDGERPADEISAEIATEVWLKLRAL